MSLMSQKADELVARYAGTPEHDKIASVRAYCNSDSAFVSWMKRGASIPVIRDARLLQQAWKRFGVARSILITLRAIKAALVKLFTGIPKISKGVAVSLLETLKPRRSAPTKDMSSHAVQLALEGC